MISLELFLFNFFLVILTFHMAEAVLISTVPKWRKEPVCQFLFIHHGHDCFVRRFTTQQHA